MMAVMPWNKSTRRILERSKEYIKRREENHPGKSPPTSKVYNVITLKNEEELQVSIDCYQNTSIVDSIML